MMAFLVAAAATACCAPDIRFTDPDVPIETGVCCEFAITLESNRTTGFGWDIAEPIDEKTVTFISSEYVSGDASLAGAPGTEIWTFMAVGKGRSVITFKYVRPWEKDVSPAKKVSFTVVVADTAPQSNS
jgi:inhibitor of cysteine peptidase